MERITKRAKRVSGLLGVCCTHFESGDCVVVAGHCSDGCPWEEAAWDRLAAYEDTGLEPEEIMALIPPPNDPLTPEELRKMDDADVWVVYPMDFSGEQLIMHALVEFDKDSGNVWLTNNLGGRSIFDDIIEDGAVVYRRKPEEGTA